uniref:V-type proton ATPase subunit C n=1 Tax=Steinernema glaseri TaxID=37863 RepID=A0A1I8AVK6_9BILA
MVVVPKVLVKEWNANYATFSNMVVPESSQLITEEGELCLFSVTLFKKVTDEYTNSCSEHGFIVRDFVYDEDSLKAGRNERDQLLQEKQRQYGPLVRWLKVNFGEIFSTYIHVKALRVFVESVLRYGLPVNFQAALLEPNKNAHKKLRSVLNKLYAHLDSSSSGSVDSYEDNQTLMSLGVQDYYSYVFFKIDIDFLSKGAKDEKEVGDAKKSRGPNVRIFDNVNLNRARHFTEYHSSHCGDVHRLDCFALRYSGGGLRALE